MAVMDVEQLKGLQVKFRQGVEKLGLLGQCLDGLGRSQGLDLRVLGVDPEEGELCLRFAGTRYYVRVRLTDRSVGDPGMSYSVPMGWLDWGRYNAAGLREPAEQSNYYEERGLLCELDKDEFYCSLTHCEDERLQRGLLQKLARLVGRTVAQNNARSV
jgi:hypothetical protein